MAPLTAIPDFNGDGLTDLAVGIPEENLPGASNAGAVSVLYSSADGLQATAPDDQFWTQDSPDVEDQAEYDDRFGWSLAHADFNSDGFTDLAIGAASEGLSGPHDGAVHVLYGSALGLQAIAPEDQFWTQDSPDVEEASEADDRFGHSLAAGDFNGDGFADLAIGAALERTETMRKVGAVNVLYGSALGLQAVLPADQLWTQDSPGVEDQVEPADRFGWSLAAGDFNADGFADLAIGTPLESLESARVRSAGAVNVLYGSALGLQAAPEDQFWTQDSPDVEDQAESRDRMGWFLATGDFNADGYSDLALGVPFEDLTPLGAGAVSVLYGSALGLQATAPEDQFWTQDSPDVEDQAEPQDWFGWSLAAGDFNADGFTDLAIGVRLEDVDGVSNAGAVNVLYGSSLGLQATAPEDQFWTQNSPDVEDQAEEQDEFGWSLAAWDIGGDGFDELIIGVPLQDVGGIGDAGAVSVLYGSLDGLQATSPPDQLWTQDSPDVEDQAEFADAFGDRFLGGSQCPHPCHSPLP
jgi:hypothetical protein